jgi:ribosomal subunit interface protein
MKYNIRGENIKLTTSNEEYIQTKLNKLVRYFNSPVEATANVKVKNYNNQQTIETTIPLKEMTLRAEVSNVDLYTAVDLVIDKLERQIRKYKTKINRKMKEKESIKYYFEDQIEEVTDDDEIEIVRTKKFNIKPMDVEEAILQMNMLGHEFFVFIDSETNNYCTVYKRKDGKYGLIESA